MEKSAFRRTLLHRRDAIDASSRCDAEAQLLQRLVTFLRTHHATCHSIALYHPIKNEVNPLSLRLLLPSHIYALPRMHEGSIYMCYWDERVPLEYGAFGTMQPPPNATPLIPDVCIVPLVGFDRTGTRLGYGKGYYDRYLADHPQIIRIGVAFSCQEVHKLPYDAHDQRLHHIITETECITL